MFVSSVRNNFTVPHQSSKVRPEGKAVASRFERASCDIKQVYIFLPNRQLKPGRWYTVGYSFKLEHASCQVSFARSSRRKWVKGRFELLAQQVYRAQSIHKSQSLMCLFFYAAAAAVAEALLNLCMTARSSFPAYPRRTTPGSTLDGNVRTVR